MGWIQYVKDAFFIIGSVAGLVALFRPLFESKFKRDLAHANDLLTALHEDAVMALEHYTYLTRHIPDEVLRPLDHVSAMLRENRQAVRFIGPLRRNLQRELHGLVEAYIAYRKFVQVPWWEPRKYGDAGESAWFFNKGAFREGARLFDEYATHLDKAGEAACLVQKRFQRFQALTELHFYEALVPKWSTSRKFKAIGLDCL
jgi:hypothetical protein